MAFHGTLIKRTYIRHCRQHEGTNILAINTAELNDVTGEFLSRLDEMAASVDITFVGVSKRDNKDNQCHVVSLFGYSVILVVVTPKLIKRSFSN